MRGYYAFNFRRHEHAVARTTPAVIVEPRAGIGYGCTEAATFISANPWGARRLGSVGLPVPGVELTIQDESGQVLPASICAPGTTPKYLFLATKMNRNGDRPYTDRTLRSLLTELAALLDVRDSTGDFRVPRKGAAAAAFKAFVKTACK